MSADMLLAFKQRADALTNSLRLRSQALASGRSPDTAGATVPSSTPATDGIGGSYRQQSASSGVRRISVVPVADGTIRVSGLGPSVLTLERDGDGYIVGGAVLFGQGDHPVRLMLDGAALRLVARHPSGASFETALER